MGPGAIVVIEELGQDLTEVALVQDQQPIQALAADGLDQALQMSVRTRGSVGRPEHTDAFGLEDGVETSGVLGVAIAHQEVDGWIAILNFWRQVARLLDDPVGVGVGGAGGEQDAAAAELHHHQHVESAQKHGLNGEEVAGQDALSLTWRRMIASWWRRASSSGSCSWSAPGRMTIRPTNRRRQA